MFYHNGVHTRHVIHAIKYRNNPEVGTYLAKVYTKELKKSTFFKDIKGIIPLPLHWQRQLSRHYNQSHYIAKGISDETGIPVWKNVVKRIKNNPSQTRMSSSERGNNVKGIFHLQHPEFIAGKHILLVDDVTTTGATLASCAQELAKATNVKVSVFTLSIAARTAIPTLHDTPEMSVFGGANTILT